MTAAKGDDDLKAILEALRTQGERLDDVADLNRETREKVIRIEERTAHFERDLVDLRDSLARLNGHLEASIESKIRTETMLSNLKNGFASCQRASSSRWRILLGFFVSVAVVIATYLIYKTLNGR